MSDKKLAVEKVDRNMAVGEAGTEKVVWHTADDAPLRLTGFYFRKKGGEFRRLRRAAERVQHPRRRELFPNPVDHILPVERFSLF